MRPKPRWALRRSPRARSTASRTAGAGGSNGPGTTRHFDAIRWTIALVPLGFLGLSCLFMRLNPLGRGVHDRVVRELAGA